MDFSISPAFLKNDLAIDDFGNVYLSGLINSKLVFGTIILGDYKIEKIDSSGNNLWNISLIGKIYFQGLISDHNNNLYGYGFYEDTLWFDNTNNLITSDSTQHNFIIKLNMAGNLVLLKDYTQFDPDFYRFGELEIDLQNNLWVSGVSNQIQNTLIKVIDPDGVVMQTFEQSSVRAISGLCFDDNGNFWVTGSTSSGNQSFNGFIANAPFTYNIYVVKYDSNGSAQFVRFIEDVTSQSPSIVCDNSGNAYLSGILSGDFSFGSLTAQGVEWVYDFFLTKIDSTGEFIWLNEVPFGNPGADATVGSSNFLSCPDDGSIYLTGYSRNNVDWGNEIISTSFGLTDILLLKYSTEGELIWVKNAGSSVFDKSDAVVVDDFGNCYLAGQVGANSLFDSLSFVGDNTNSFVAKVKPADIITGFNQFSERNNPEIVLQNYPNPFNPYTTIKFILPETAFVQLSVYDVLGKKILDLVDEELPASNYSINFDGKNLSSGIYIYRLFASKNNVVLFSSSKGMILLK